MRFLTSEAPLYTPWRYYLHALEVVQPGREALADDRELGGGVGAPCRERHVDRRRRPRRHLSKGECVRESAREGARERGCRV